MADEDISQEDISQLQFFDALDGDVKSPQAFKQRLLLENNNNQLTGVTTLFSFYGY
ncbi:MAG: hypothetical protein ACKVOW_05295 [Chitinophagaceae bacterium]